MLGVLGGCWGVLGCSWRFWGMLEDVQRMLGAAKLPILAPGTPPASPPRGSASPAVVAKHQLSPVEAQGLPEMPF